MISSEYRIEKKNVAKRMQKGGSDQSVRKDEKERALFRVGVRGVMNTKYREEERRKESEKKRWRERRKERSKRRRRKERGRKGEEAEWALVREKLRRKEE